MNEHNVQKPAFFLVSAGQHLENHKYCLLKIIKGASGLKVLLRFLFSLPDISTQGENPFGTAGDKIRISASDESKRN